MRLLLSERPRGHNYHFSLTVSIVEQMKGVPLEGFLEHKTQGYHENIFFSNKNSIYDRNHKVSKVHF